MQSNHEGTPALLRSTVLAVSGSLQCGVINCRNLQSIAITGRATFNGSATGAVTVNVYHSPDGKTFDTIALGTATLTCSAGNAVQATAIITVPDTGWAKITIDNADSTYTATNITVWASIKYQFIEDRQTSAAS